MKILLLGYRDVGAYCLEYLLKSNKNIVGVAVSPDDRGIDTWCRSVKKIALENNLNMLNSIDLKSEKFIAKIDALKPDIIFSCYYPKIIPKAILDIPCYGAINLHGGLLPKYRGCYSGAWSIINGEKETGVTMHYIEPEIDAGDIIDIKKVTISNRDTAFSLYQKVGERAIDLFKEKLLLFEKRGKVQSIKQDHTLAQYYGRQVPFRGEIDWKKDKREVVTLIRALCFPPFKPAFTMYNNRKLLIWEAKECKTNVKPSKKRINGEIVEVTQGKGIVVAASDGYVSLMKAGWEDKGDSSLAYNFFKNKDLKVGMILS